MAYKIQFDNGHTVEFDSQPSDADIDEAYAQTGKLPSPKGVDFSKQIPAGPEADQYAQQPEPTTGDYVRGGLETAANLATGAAAFPLGIVTGLGRAAVTGENFDPAIGKMMQEFTYQPRGEVGKEWSEKAGEFVNRNLVPLMPMAHLPAITPKEALQVTKGRIKVPEKVESAIAALDKAPDKSEATGATPYGTPEQRQAWEQRQFEIAQRQAEAERTQPSTEMAQHELFDQPEQFRGANPYEAVPGDWRVDENGMPIKADLSMEAQNLQEPLQRNLWGDELAQKHPQEEPTPLTQAIDNIPDTPFKGDAREQALDRLDKGPIQAPGELEAAKLEAESPFARVARMKGQGGAINPEVFQEGFRSLKRVIGDLAITAKGLGDQLKIEAWKGGERVGGMVLEKTNKYDPAEVVDAFAPMVGVDKSVRGQGIAAQMYKAAADLGNDIVPSGRKTAEGAKMWQGFEKRGLSQGMRIPKGQRGALKIDWSRKAESEKVGEITGLSKIFPELTKVAETPEQVAEVAKNSPDVPTRGLIGKGIGQFTKGMLYEKFKTDNPIVKFTYDTFSNAVDVASHNFNQVIKKEFTPMLRKLSDQEMAEIGKVMVEAMKRQKELTPEFLKEQGFSDKQIAVATKMKEIHEDNLNSLNQSRKLAGKSPVEAYEAYIAGLATGNFRKLIYKEGKGGEMEVVGIVGSDFRNKMNKHVSDLLAAHPEWKASEEKYTGVRRTKQESTKALQEALSIVSDNNPNFKAFAQALDEVMTSKGYGALGAAKHTLAKKGIFGMEGAKPWESDYQNAKDMFNAQIRYTQTMNQWAEYSKAMDSVAKVFSDPEVQKAQPNALKMSQDYIDSILGKNPTKMGQALEDFTGHIGDMVGVGPGIIKHSQKLMRNTVNSLFFTLNHTWMAVNVLQPFMVMPETRAFMTGRGLDIHIDPTGFTDLAARGTFSSLKHIVGWPETPFETLMWKYAKEHGIDQTQLVEAPNAIRGGAGFALSQTLKFGANAVEAGPRSIMFSTLAHMLREGGYGKDPEIFNVARQLTDMAMTDYRTHEQIRFNQQLGPMSETAANLTSFKQNTLSRYALFAREMGQGHYKAFTAAMITAMALGGIMGLPGYQEMDWMVNHLSNLLGKPTSLSKLTLDLGDRINSTKDKAGDILNMGVGAYWGVDLHNRIGNPQIMPSITGGTGKLVDIAKAGIKAGTDRDEWSAKLLARQVAPPPLQPWMDTNWFTTQTPKGEIAVDKYGKGSVIRNDADKLWKRLGFTGSHEAKTRAQDYAVRQQDQYYQDQQKHVTELLAQAIAANKGDVPKAQYQALAKAYVEAQGNPDSFGQMVTKAQQNYRTSARTRRIIDNQGGNLGQGYKLERSYVPE